MFVPALIKRVSEDTNPWQPTFDADSAIAKIRRQVYPNVTETFKGKDPLAAPVRRCQTRLHSLQLIGVTHVGIQQSDQLAGCYWEAGNDGG